ncbi:MAG: monovalent cation/H+ antiporter complex subunit F [Sulfuritalea sp.]|nr:monovalent cation/H+ antiporter complex subunit F [Sulfuritalea sp.]
MLAAATLALLVTISLVLVRATLGPTVFDRLQAANTIGTCSMLLLALLGFLGGRPEFLDLALVYGLLNVIGVIAVLNLYHPDKPGAAGDKGIAARSGEVQP